MPVFDMQCTKCGAIYRDKYFFRHKDRLRYVCSRIECLGRTEPMIPDKLMINLDSTFEGYDEVLGVHLRGATHRKEVMKEQGLVERNQVTKRTDKGKWV